MLVRDQPTGGQKLTLMEVACWIEVPRSTVGKVSASALRIVPADTNDEATVSSAPSWRELEPNMMQTVDNLLCLLNRNRSCTLNDHEQQRLATGLII